jgi:hypothetical protein
MNISEFSPTPGITLSETDIVRLASFGFEVLSLVPYASVIIDRVLTRLAEIYPSTPKHWTRDELLGWLNDGVTELNLIAGYLTRTATVSWSQTSNILSLDSKVVWDDGTVGYKPKAWCSLGTTKILVYPLSQKISQNISVLILYQPTPIPEAGEALSVPPQYIDAIEHYMYARARFKEAGAEFVQADIDYKRFFELANELKIRAGRQRRVGFGDRFKTRSSYVRLKDE